MKAKSGNPIETVQPIVPDETFTADVADPGKAAKTKAKEIKAKKGKYGQTKAPAFKPIKAKEDTEKEVETSWIGIKLVDENNNPVVGEQYEVELPDGSVSKGSVGNDGTAKIEGFEPGMCKVKFPNLEDDSVSAK